MNFENWLKIVYFELKKVQLIWIHYFVKSNFQYIFIFIY